MSNIVLSFKETEEFSKCRIIQKNLVHFQGFPDYLYDKNLLISFNYFGQYGNITKIVLSKKYDRNQNKNQNSAYLTFEDPIQAAYCILAVDSILIDKQLVRAFFGTTKYCNYFLNNSPCFNQNKCLFLHRVADQSEILGYNKYGYSDHIKLAKKIIKFGSNESILYVINHKNPLSPGLPILKTIYYKEEIMIKSLNHRKEIKIDEEGINLSNSSFNNDDITNTSSNYSSINDEDFNNSLIKLKDKNHLFYQNYVKKYYNPQYNKFFIFISRNKSRFFNSSDFNSDSSENPKRFLIDNLCSRLGFFQYNEYYKNLEKEYYNSYDY